MAFKRAGIRLLGCVFAMVFTVMNMDARGAAGEGELEPGVVTRGHEAASRLQDMLAAFSSLSFDFHETHHDERGGLIRSVKGRATLRKPNLMRWETLEPFMQLLVSDGKTVWLYDPDLLQATRRPLDLAVGNSPGLLLGGDARRLHEEFDVEERSTRDGSLTYRLQLRSADGLFDAMEIEFRQGLPVTMHLWGLLGRRTSFRFTRIVSNSIAAGDGMEIFRFVPPAGTEVIDETRRQP